MCITSLASLLHGIVGIPSVFDVTTHGLRTDSREVRPGDVFVALAGQTTPAGHYVDEAIRTGAIAVLLESPESRPCYEYQGALVVPVAGLRARLGDIADRFFDHPSRRMKVIGVTGTNGKTSVSFFISQLLAAAGIPCGVLGTLGYGMPGELAGATHTTPDVVAVNRALAGILGRSGRAAAMEVSSHALDQGRTDGVTITGAVFTNLSRDHLDYHGSMEAYGAAKTRLFQRESLHFAVINFDDPFGRQLYDQTEGLCDRVRYSRHEPQTELWLTDFSPEGTGFRATLNGLWGEFEITAPLLGDFNVSNLLAATAAVLSLGVSPGQVQSAVSQLVPPPGRMEMFPGHDGRRVVVDYAHTADALGSVLSALRPHTAGRLICVFGCGGERDRGKRPDMAREAENLADLVIVTDDNPRNEKPEAIIQEISAGFARPEAVRIIHDRAEAIAYAVAQAGPQDMVLVAGKGHELTQEVAGRKYPFSDAQQVRDELAKAGGEA